MALWNLDKQPAKHSSTWWWSMSHIIIIFILLYILQNEQATEIALNALNEYFPFNATEYNSVINIAIDEIQQDVSLHNV